MGQAIHLDVRTAYVASAFACGAAAVAMTYVWKCRRTYAGFGAWVLSIWAGGLGATLVAGRGVIPDAVSVLVANFFNIGGAMLMMGGLHSFVGERPRWSLYALGLGGFLAAMAFFLFVHPSLQIRLAIISFVAASLLFWSARIVQRRIPLVVGASSPLILWTFLLLAGLYLVRGILAIVLPPPSENFMQASVQHSFTALASMVSMSSIVLGLIVLNAQRVERDLQQAIDECKVLRGIIPICAKCKKIRDDQGAWNQLEHYISEHTDAQFTHGVCPDCARTLYPKA